MKTFHDFWKQVSDGPANRRTRSRLLRALTAAIFAACLGVPGAAHAQVLPDAVAGGFRLSAGAEASGQYLQYGQRDLGGFSAFVDAETHRRLGIEGEARWLELNQTEDVHVETYSVGLRYHMNFGRFQPYAKGLIGFGDFNFPFNYAHGRYLVVTGGGGLEYRWTPRIRFRIPDVEYQDWPQFTYGAMSSVGISAGVKVGIF
jgi:Outer membrane protein beta-barrel domain